MKVAGKLTLQLGISSRGMNYGHACVDRNPAICGSNAVLRDPCDPAICGSNAVLRDRCDRMRRYWNEIYEMKW